MRAEPRVRPLVGRALFEHEGGSEICDGTALRELGSAIREIGFVAF